jgi:hypothetical protein
VELDYATSCSYELIRRLLKNTLKPWQKQEWCIPDVSAEFVAAMKDVPDLYEEPYDPMCPVVCFDESSKQLIAKVCANRYRLNRPAMTPNTNAKACAI